MWKKIRKFGPMLEIQQSEIASHVAVKPLQIATWLLGLY